MTIYIGNLSFDAEVEDIVGVFSSYGEVTNCKLPCLLYTSDAADE